MAIAFGKIANALQSAASDHILGISQDIYDTTLNAYQSDLNLKVKQLYTTLNDEYPLLLTPPGQTADSSTNTYFSTNVTINPNLGKITALRFVKPGGKSTEFLKADGSLDTNTYVTTTTLESYLPLSGGTLTGVLTIKKSSYEMITLERTDSANSVLISFKNTNGLLGWLGMNGSANQGIIRFSADLQSSYTVLDSGNYNSYTPILNSSSTHATKSSVIYAPTTAGTSGQYLTSSGSGAPTWTSLTMLKNPYSLKLKDSEGTIVTYDGSETKDLTGGVYQSTISKYLLETNILYGATLGESKSKLLTESIKSGRNVGQFITILAETITKWNQPNDYAYTSQGGIGSLFKIGGGYNNSAYSTWISSTVSEQARIGIVRQFNGEWKIMKYLAWDSDIPTKLSQLTDDVVSGKYLPLSGGTLTGPLTINYSSWPLIRVNATSGSESNIRFELNEVNKGYVGYLSGQGTFLYNTTAAKYLAINDSGIVHISGTAISLDGHTHTSITDGTISLIAQYNNEINFGGTNPSSVLYFGYRAVDSKPIPTNFIFGGSDGSASLTASRFIMKGSSASYVLLGNGTHKTISDFLLKTEFASKELESNLTTITKTLTVTSDWMDTGISGLDLPSDGTYIVQVHVAGNDSVAVMWSCYWSGVMSWYIYGTDDTETDEILLHRAGHAYNNTIYLRTIMQTSSGKLKLQIAANTNIGAAYTYTFKFKQVI